MYTTLRCSYIAVTGGCALFLSLGLARPGHAQTLDQIYFDPANTNSSAGGSTPPSFRRAQTFTVGLAGTLAHVDNRGLAGTTMRILATSGGVPIDTILASTDSLAVSGDGWNQWDLTAAALSVTPGQVLAMEMLGGSFGGNWDGRSPGGYVGGGDYYLNPSFGVNSFTDDNKDNFLRTYVNTVPEPGSVALLIGLSVTGAGFLSRRKIANKAA